MTDYIELKISIEPFDPWSDLLSQELANIGFESFTKEENVLHAFISESTFDKQSVGILLGFYAGEVDVKFEYSKIKSTNWNKEWEANFDPVEIGGRVYIRAPFHPERPDLEIEILLTPKMSFGTGHHATTFMMMEEMLELDLVDKKVLDVGCGTSILSILAEKLGSESILAIDNDDWAVENSRENAVINNSVRINVEKAEISSVNEKSFNVILANINRNVIVDDLNKYVKLLEPDGHILLSGFREDDIQMITDIADKNAMTLSNKRELGEWRMLHFVKTA